MPFQKGQSGNPAGRKAGIPNKLNASVKAAIEQAFDKVGGATYLERIARDEPAVFCQLLGKVLPTQLEHSGVIMSDTVDRPPRETREEWFARRSNELAMVPAAGSAE